MKVLTSLSLAFVLAFGAASATAGGKHKHHKDWHVSVHHNYYGGDRYYKSPRHYRHKKHYYKHHYKPYYKPYYKKRYRHRHGYRYYDYPRYRNDYRRHRGHRYYYPYRGVSLSGAVVGHSAYHLHDNNVCYDDHGGRSGYSEVVGCHRIERLPDGGERRVDVPLSECD